MIWWVSRHIFTTILSAALAHALDRAIACPRGLARTCHVPHKRPRHRCDGRGTALGRGAVTRLRKDAQSERQLHEFIIEAPVAIAMFDREMRYLVTSRQWIADFSPDEHNLIGP